MLSKYVYTFNAKLPLRRHPAQLLLCISTIATWGLPALGSSVTMSLPLWTQLPSQVWLPRLVPHSWSLIPLKHLLCQPLGSSWTISKATARGFVIQLLVLRDHDFPNTNLLSFLVHCFLAQYFMPLHIIWSIVFPDLALETTFWLVGNSPILRFSEFSNRKLLFKWVCYHFHATLISLLKWKVMKKQPRKWCQKFFKDSFEVTFVIGNMWGWDIK